MLKLLGKTKVKLFPIGLGTGFTKDELKAEKKLINIIHYGIDRGINLIDTGENYENGLCEKLLGKALKDKRDKIIIATKFSPENSSYRKIINSCNNSLKRLKVDCIDLYQFHWPNPKIPLEISVKALKKLQKDGKIRFIGASNFSKKQMVEIESFFGKSKFVSTQEEYNLYERAVEQNGILGYCNKKKLSLIAYSPLDQGRFNAKNINQFNLINKLIKKYQKTRHQIILSWLVSKKQVIPIPKTTSLKHLIDNIKSTQFNLAPKDIGEINREFDLKRYLIPTNQINISQKGERDRRVYQSLKEAMDNKLGFVPSPKELSKEILKSADIKPVRVIPSKNSSNRYDLINGRIRYWGWVIAFGTKKPIPCYIRKDLTVD